MSNERPMFVRSMYASKETLLEAKCEWLEGRVDELEEALRNSDCLDVFCCGREDYVCLACELKVNDD